MQAKCVDIVVAILYIILVSAFLGWRLFYLNGKKKNAPSRAKPFWNAMEGGEVHSANQQKEENPSIQVHVDISSLDEICLKFRSVLWFHLRRAN